MTDTPESLFQTKISDWRMPNEAPEELSGRQAEDWNVKITPGGYGGLRLNFTAPDGSERNLYIEVDKGNLTFATYRDDEQDAKVTVAADATYVTSGHTKGRYGRATLRYDENGADVHNGQIPEGLAD